MKLKKNMSAYHLKDKITLTLIVKWDAIVCYPILLKVCIIFKFGL